VREAAAEIQKLAKKDPALAAAGAVLFLEKVSPALEQVDSSSGAIGTAESRDRDPRDDHRRRRRHPRQARSLTFRPRSTSISHFIRQRKPR
jgi:hypothetical protein